MSPSSIPDAIVRRVKAIAVVCTNDEVHQVEAAEDLLLGDEAE